MHIHSIAVAKGRGADRCRVRWWEEENGKDGFLAIDSFNGRRQQTDHTAQRKERERTYIPLV